MTMLKNFKVFIEDEKAWDMFITGRAGTGKTHSMGDIVKYCIENDINYVVCAFTHKACDVLRTKLPENANVMTLSKFLKKRPTINKDAINKKHIDSTAQFGSPDEYSLVIVDEYSMVGERDVLSLQELQDPTYEGTPVLKVLYAGDPYQLESVGDTAGVKPYGEYAFTLEHNYRRAAGSKLSIPIEELVSFIEGEEVHQLTASDKFVRGVDIVDEYLACDRDKRLLAYTNRRVQELNAICQGYTKPLPNDKLFSPTTKKNYTFLCWADKSCIDQIDLPFGEPLVLGTKYRTLEYLLAMEDVQFASCVDDDGEEVMLAVEFGHYTHKIRMDKLKQLAAESNAIIEAKFKQKAAFWAKANPHEVLARKRSKAWRDFLTYNESVICLDFNHATTVHKSQGSTIDTVFVDTDDLSIAIDMNYMTYLRLMYVAISRASNMVMTN